MLLLGLFGLLGLVISAVGIYGVMAYVIAQRTREIGVRMALGAQPSTVLRLVLGHGLLLVALGLAIGLVAALVLASFVPQDLLPNVSVRDPLTFALTSAVMGSVALIASYIPARRATRIDPLIALRTD
jgi:putative ABC transport system permease protein